MLTASTLRSARAEGVLDELRGLADRAREFAGQESVGGVNFALVALAEARAFLSCLDMLDLLDQDEVEHWYSYIAGTRARPD
jgi:hypothetical protein